MGHRQLQHRSGRGLERKPLPHVRQDTHGFVSRESSVEGPSPRLSFRSMDGVRIYREAEMCSCFFSSLEHRAGGPFGASCLGSTGLLGLWAWPGHVGFRRA